MRGRTFARQISLATLLPAVCIVATSCTSTQQPEPDLDSLFDPCRVSVEIRERHGLGEPKYFDVNHRIYHPEPVGDSLGCSYTTEADQSGFAMVVGLSDDWLPGNQFGYGYQIFEPVSTSDYESTVGCVATNDIHGKPFCDVLIPYKGRKILVEVRYWFPQGSLEDSSRVTKNKAIELANEIMNSLPRSP
ncbi:hypothetical protein [Nocardia sp. NPDC050413]|uniref:hypothetical protein n=1 Tax=Nocardia sp. NPDC050413 TaxID=3155784 RepID=UPI0034045B31